MSRLAPRTPLSQLPSLDAATLDQRFDDFETATASINAENLRDGAVDLPQYAAQQIIKHAQTVTLGPPDWDLVTNIVTTPLVCTPSIAPTTNVVVDDPTGTNDSFVNFGITGQSLTLVDVLRVSWSLKVNAIYTGTPYDTAGARGQFDLQHTGAGTVTVTDGLHGVPFYLEWDVTSNALANWVAVPDQTVFNTAFNIPSGGVTGGYINECPATSVQPVWTSRGVGVDKGKVASDAVYERGWRSLRGSWIYTPPLGVTIYGLRLVFKPALYHPCNAMTSLKNALCYDEYGGVNVTIYHQSGFMTAVVQRMI